MARLLVKTAFGGGLPARIGQAELREADVGQVSFVQPRKGAADAVAKALSASVGTGFPGPNEALIGEGGRALWCGPGQALVTGAAFVCDAAAVIDQSDAWAVAVLEGPAARDVLARLTPLDIRPDRFSEGQTARTLVGHMTAQLTPVGPEAFEVMVFRSMAGTFVHDLTRAMGFFAGRAMLG